jgi:hypothetical protein
MRDAAAALLEAWGVGVRLEIAERPAFLPLIGLTRGLVDLSGDALVLDFGHTSVKAAFVAGDSRRVTSMRMLPSLSALPVTEQPRVRAELERAQALADFMTGLIAERWLQGRTSGLRMSPRIAVSIACYVADNHPMDYRRAEYAALALLCDNLGAYLSDAVGARVGQRVSVTLDHDCTAAARACPGREKSALLMLGTWVGAGYPPRTN